MPRNYSLRDFGDGAQALIASNFSRRAWIPRRC